MATVKINYRNILETGTVTVTNENNSYPSYRLYDRDVGKLFKGNNNGGGTFAINVDQGPSNAYEVDRMIIPSGHSLNGLVLDLSHSNDGNNYTSANNATGGANNIELTFNATTKRYWKLTITTGANAPELPELFLTKDYTFERNVKIGITQENRKNVTRTETLSGYMRRVKHGSERGAFIYELGPMNSTQKASLELWNTTMDGVKSVYVRDHNGTLRYMEMLNDLSFVNLTSSLWSARLELLEVL